MPDRIDSDDREARDRMIAEGEAALYFTEVLALKMIDKGLLEPDDVIEALDIAASAKRTAADDGITPRLSNQAAAVLSSIMNSVSAVRATKAAPPPVKS